MGIRARIRYAVDKKLLIANPHLVTGNSNDPLDKVFGFVFGIDKNHDISRFRSSPLEHQVSKG